MAFARGSAEGQQNVVVDTGVGLGNKECYNGYRGRLRTIKGAG